MGQRSEPADLESLQDSGQRRRRAVCLDAFIVVSILVLFAAVTTVAVGGLMAVSDLRSELRTSRQPRGPERLTASVDPPPQTYKTQNFAYLEAISSQLALNSTMRLASVPYFDGTSVGSNFDFDREHHSLTPMQAGTYFMYIDLHLSCTLPSCPAGVLSVQVGDKLTCEVDLPSNKTIVKERCWTVTRLEKQKLLAQITVPKGGLPDWALQVGSSGLGMFLVD